MYDTQSRRAEGIPGVLAFPLPVILTMFQKSLKCATSLNNQHVHPQVGLYLRHGTLPDSEQKH
jgi:hypothetical protein